ncbi:MAG: hypothetical protein OJF47_003995 [Nitrospira sp.]|nr:MAG: hypothetical protein OJF47_003995 [Nitrospira sp.]
MTVTTTCAEVVIVPDAGEALNQFALSPLLQVTRLVFDLDRLTT